MFASLCSYTLLSCPLHFTQFLKKRAKKRGGDGEEELIQMEPYYVPGTVLLNFLLG